MKTMHMPGFTAEASLYRTSGHYHTGLMVSQIDGSISLAVIPAQAGPYLSMRCESWNRLRIRCTAVTFGAYAPHTVEWYINGRFHSAVGNLYPNPFASTSVNFACSPSRPSVYSAVAIDSLDRVGHADPSIGTARCLTGNP
jgi:hypothetical protein